MGLSVRIINASTSYPKGSGKRLWQKFFQFPSLAPLVIAASTPKKHRVRLEQIEHAKTDRSAEVAAMSFLTPSAPQIYALADQFRRLGVITIAGGPHATLMTAEALQHFDIVVKGPAENIWPVVLDDIEAGTGQRVYQGQMPSRVPSVNRNLYPRSWHTIDTIEASRGCTNACPSFCAVPHLYGPRKYLARPVIDVITEAKTINRNFLFVDNNLFAIPAYAKNLMRALIPLKKNWVAGATLKTFMEHPELLPLMKAAGCQGLFLGLETLNDQNFVGQEKDTKHYAEGIRRIHDAGIAVTGSFILGLPYDTPYNLKAIPRFVNDNGIEVASLNILTPFPGTPIFRKMQRQGRILTTDWSQYTTEKVVFRPERMTPEELQHAYHDIVRETLSLGTFVRASVLNRTAAIHRALPTYLARRLSNEAGRLQRQFSHA